MVVSNENLHTDALIIDGLVITMWSRDVFLDMRKGGLTAANCTCSVWEGIRVSLDNIAAWKRMFEAHSDLILQVKTSEDIPRAKQEGKTGIILGWLSKAVNANTEGKPSPCTTT